MVKVVKWQPKESAIAYTVLLMELFKNQATLEESEMKRLDLEREQSTV